MFMVSSIEDKDLIENSQYYNESSPVLSIWDVLARCGEDSFKLYRNDLEQSYGKRPTELQLGSYL